MSAARMPGDRPTPEALDRLRADLRARLPEATARLKLEADDCAPWGSDASHVAPSAPDLVFLAESEAEVAVVLSACSRHGVPVTPAGARTGKSGGSVPVYGGLVLDLTRMDRIRSISATDMVAVVEPGVVLGALHEAVEALGLFYPPDPNSWESCTLGGNVAENAGGPRAVKYGVTRDYVIGLRWVTPSGEVLEVGRRTLKGVAGLDLVGLFVGSEGTLGVATEITVQLLPLPRSVSTALLCFATTLDAVAAVDAILGAGLLPRCVELLDDVAVAAVSGRFTFPSGTGAALIVEVDGADPEVAFAELARLCELADPKSAAPASAHEGPSTAVSETVRPASEGAAAEPGALDPVGRGVRLPGTARSGPLEVLVAQDEEQRRRLWAVRRQISPALSEMRPAKVSEDIVVPRSQMVPVVDALKRMGEALGLTVATYGHAGDGNLHANVLYDGPAQLPRVEEALTRMMELTLAAGGTITGEHGVGVAKRAFLPLEQSPKLLELQRGLRALFDPAGVMNPGKIF